jgi:hypothetical protein
MQKVINFLGLIIGLIGLAIGIVSYLHTVKYKEISYNIYKPSYKVFDKDVIEGESNLKILTRDSTKINQSIYLTTLSIWNSGDLTINKSDVRKKIKIDLKGIDKIIDFKIIKETESGVSDFKYEVNKDSIYNFDWKYFDPKHGIKFLILYIGDETISSKLKGNVLETKLVEFVYPEVKDISYKNEIIFYRNFIYAVITVLVILVTVMSFYNIKRKIKKEGKIKIDFNFDSFFYLICPLILIIGIIYVGYSFYFKINEVPF